MPEEPDLTPPPVQPPTQFVIPRVGDPNLPTRNQAAVISLYCGIFSVIPIVGLLLGPVAIVQGRRGLETASLMVGERGKTAAKVGRTLGWICTVVNGLLVLLML